MRIKCLGLCRGDGKGYARIRVEGASLDDVDMCTLLGDGVEVPSLWMPDGASPHEGTLVFPLLHNAAFDIVARKRGGCEAFSIRIAPCKLKWLSRLNYRMRPSLCASMRGVDERDGGRLKLSLFRCMPDGDESVWRIAAESPMLDADIAFSVTGSDGRRLDITPMLFEDQRVPEGMEGGIKARVVVSLRIPAGVDGFCVLARDASGGSLPGMIGFDPDAFQGELHGALYRVRTAADAQDYERWCKAHLASMQGAQAWRAGTFDIEPLVSIVVPCYRCNERYLKDMMNSVMGQTYAKWELVLVDSECESSRVSCVAEEFADGRIVVVPVVDNGGIVGNTNLGVEHAAGDYVAFLDYDDVLEPDALYEYVRAINGHPDAGALYCDEDAFETLGVYCDPVFKTDFNRDLLYAHNCVTHWLMVKRAVLDEIGLSAPEMNGAQDYDMVLRVLETGREIVHVPKLLYHWRRHADSTAGDNLESKPYAHIAGKAALSGHFERLGISAVVEDGDGPFVYRVRYELPSPPPSVEVLIPSKDHVDVLDRCVASILEKSTYSAYRITIIENNSIDEATFAYYRELEQRSSRVRVIEWPGEFNYSKIMNFGAASTDADLLLLLNNDTEVIAPDFIEEMAGCLQRSDVGVVGAKLFYYDGLVQHAGMLIGPHDTVVHVNQNVPDSWGAYLGRAVRPGNFSSVTGACQMVRRAVFEEVGGYSEEFAVGYNDADFCCKVRKAGYSVVFTPYAKLYHNEFVSRGREEGDPVKTERWRRERARMMSKWPDYFEKGDPFTNPCLDRDSLYFALPQNQELEQ